ncbi:MAG: alpha/beta fold hydrolase [Rhodobacteraceae bacterium]|nr:alpha/beta fold hydrolase [Paracoccaceae bacterium]
MFAGLEGLSGSEASRIAPDPELLQAIYGTAVTPENYDTLMEAWQRQLERALASVPREVVEADGPPIIDLSEALPHLETSGHILDRLGRTAHDGVTRHSAMRNGLHMLIDHQGRVVWHNARAARLLDLRSGAHIDSLPVDAATRARLRAALPRGPADSSRRATLAFVVVPPGQAPLHMVATPGKVGEGPALLVLRSATSRWSPLLAEMMRDAFDLSAAELDVVSLMVDGFDLPEIARARDRKLNTVRTQLKAILRKTHSRTQAQVIRLALSLAAHLPATGQGERRRHDVAFLSLTSGRRMPWRRLGPENGRPALFLHGMLDGIGISDRAHEILSRLGLQLIAPERPFFGSAMGEPLPPSRAVAAFADDLDALCDHLKVEALPVIGHMAGSVYAFGFAARHPARVRAIICVAGGVPILSPRQFDLMSRRQRLVAFTARYAPAALPFFLRAGIRQIDAGGEHRFVDALYESSPLDQALLRRQEIFEIVTDGVRYAVEQGHHAFETDSYHVVRDWSALVETTDCPVTLIHGRHDPVVAAATVEAFHQRNLSRSRLRMIEDAGQLVYHSHPEAVFEAVIDALG